VSKLFWVLWHDRCSSPAGRHNVKKISGASLETFDATANNARPRTPARILLAEDDLDMRNVIAEALRKDGYVVQEVEDGGRLLERVTAHHLHALEAVDLIISDIRMPVFNGLQILAGLREPHGTVPVIMMTAFGDRETRAQAELLGAILFDKPFAIDDLRTAVHKLVPVS
jgi:CheY-like chemotaxis protein